MKENVSGCFFLNTMYSAYNAIASSSVCPSVRLSDGCIIEKTVEVSIIKFIFTIR